eukprot:3109827-Amphidinium_carterae.1
MCVTVGGYAIGKVSGGSLNPAVSVGISTSHILGGGMFWPCIIYSLFEVVAGVLASAVFFLTQPSEVKDVNGNYHASLLTLFQIANVPCGEAYKW